MYGAKFDLLFVSMSQRIQLQSKFIETLHVYKEGIMSKDKLWKWVRDFKVGVSTSKKFKTVQLAKQIIVLVVWNEKGISFIGFLHQRQTVDETRCCKI